MFSMENKKEGSEHILTNIQETDSPGGLLLKRQAVTAVSNSVSCEWL